MFLPANFARQPAGRSPWVVMDESDKGTEGETVLTDECSNNSNTCGLGAIVEAQNNEGAEAITKRTQDNERGEDHEQAQNISKGDINEKKQEAQDLVRNMVLETQCQEDLIKVKIHEKLVKVHEGMVITMGYLHCMMALNVPAAFCLTLFLWIKSSGVPNFLIMFLFSFLAIFCPSVITEVTLLMLEPPLDICENLSDNFRNTAKLANRKLGLESKIEGDKKKK